MGRFSKSLDKYSAKFLGRSQVFLMDLTISIACSVIVAIVSFLLDQDIFQDRIFDLIWGVAAGAGSALMYWLLKTYVIVIRHFSFKDTFLLGAAAQGGIFFTFVVAGLLGFTAAEAGSIAIIGGADGPTAIYVSTRLLTGGGAITTGNIALAA